MKQIIKSFYTWLKNHKLLAAIIVLLLIIAIVGYFLFDSRVAEPSPSPSTIQRETLKTPSVFPTPGDVTIGGTKNPISLFFTVPVDDKTVVVLTNPTIQMRVSFLPDAPNRLILVPVTNWKEDQTYEITIKKGLLSLSGEEELKFDFSFKYKVIKQEPNNFIAPL